MALVLVLSLAACGGNAQQATQPKSESDQSQSQPGLTLAEGKTMTLTAPAGEQVSWESSDPVRATVDEKGTVKALTGRGSVTITATAGDKTESWDIALCEETEFGQVSLSSADEKLTIGVWNGSYHEFDDFRLEMMQMAGINLVIGIDPQWVVDTTMTQLLDLAQSYGVSMITDLRDWDGQTVPEYAEHPALAGFLMYDEPCATEFENLAQLKQSFDQVIPEDKLFFVNIFPEACSYESLFGDPYNPGKVDYEKYYSNLFMDTVKPEILSVDSYGLQEGGLIRTSYYHCFDVLSHKAKQENVPFWYTLLSAGHSTTDGRYITPTDQELRWQMALGMTYGSTALVHYTLTTNEGDYEPILEYGSFVPTELYDHVSQVNGEFLAWQDIYMSYDWVGTAKVDTGEENLLMTGLEYDLPLAEAGWLTGVETDQDLLVGVFQKDGKNAYMITNAGDTTKSELWLRLNFTIEDANVKLQLDQGSYQCAALISGGQIQYVPVNADNTVDITIDAYDGIFVIPIEA